MIEESVGSRNAALAGRLVFLDSGTANARIRVYGGTRPASVNDSPATTLLLEITLEKPAGAVLAGVLSLNPLASASVLASGVATWARAVNGDDASAFDMDASGIGGSGECVLSDTTLWQGGEVALLSAALG